MEENASNLMCNVTQCDSALNTDTNPVLLHTTSG